jgi:thiopurine S-methyltransferase
MDPQFWHDRWRTRQIGFHQPSPHPFLERWWSHLGIAPGARVYVPLCGKSVDMVWLAARGHAVVGSELSDVAVQEFFSEQARASPEVTPHGPFRRHTAGRYEILEGDALELTPEWLGPVAGAYDRAALVALPPELRQRYAASLATLLPANSRTLLIAFEYDQTRKAGPPFSVTPDEVDRLCAADFRVEHLERVDILGSSPKFAEQGVEQLHEVAYALTRR